MSQDHAFQMGGMPEGVHVVPAAADGEALVFLWSQEATVNGSFMQLGPWSAFEAGEIAYAILSAIPRAIALNIEQSVANVAEAIAHDLEATDE